MNASGGSQDRDWVKIATLAVAIPAALVALFALVDRLSGTNSTSTDSAPSQQVTQTAAPSSLVDPYRPPEITQDPPSELPQAEVPTYSVPRTADQQQPAFTPVAPPSVSTVDRIQISTWAYDKTGLNTYRADSAGGKNLRVDWTATANGVEVNGACVSSVRIQGPDTDTATTSSNCSDSRYLDIHQPGNYTVTVTTTQDSGAEHSDTLPVTIQ